MKKIAIILSAGSGTRFGADIPKQYHEINGKPIIYYTIKSFVDSNIFDGIVLVMQPEFFGLANSIINEYFTSKTQNCKFHMCNGGSHRQESLYFGVSEAARLFSCTKDKTSEIAIFSHCAARPIVSKEILSQNNNAIEKGYSVNTVKNIYDTVIQENADGTCSFADRTKTFLTLTPQSFISSDYIMAYEKLHDQGNDMSKYTCACSLMYDAGIPIKLIKTDETIHKLTTPEDIETIKQLIEKSSNQ